MGVKSFLKAQADKLFFRKTDGADLLSANSKPQSKLLLVFQGRQGGWVGMGRGLYQAEPVFRKSIEQCCELIRRLDGIELLDAFKTDIGAQEAHNKESTRMLIEGINQIALSDLWLSKGLRPDGSLGLSLGEATATYITGIYSLEETLAIVRMCARWDERSTGHASVLVLRSPLSEVQALCHKYVIDLKYFAALGPRRTAVFCSPEIIEPFLTALANSNTEFYRAPDQFSYHMACYAPFRDLVIKELDHLKAQKPLFNFYSSLSGNLIPPGVAFDGNYWYWMMAHSTFYHSAVASAILDGYNVILNVGSHGCLSGATTETAEDLNKTIQILDSMRNDELEVDTFNSAYTKLKELGFIEPVKAVNIANSAINTTVTGENFDQMSHDFVHDPYSQLAGLRSQGSVHFIEKDNSWLVLDYEDVASSMRNTKVFSSAPWRDTDTVLAGADVEDHKRAQEFLKPLFDRTAIEKLTTTIEKCVSTILSNIETKTTIDVVSDFAVPITELVISKFLGLTEETFLDIQRRFGHQIYRDGERIFQLQDYFGQYLAEGKQQKGSFADILLTDDGEGCLNRDEVSALMKLIWIAGTSSTGMLINNSIKILLSHPAVRLAYHSDQITLPLFVEEVLRFDPPVHTGWRSTLSEITLGGQTIPANSLVRFSLAAANRDPKKFDKPDIFMAQRNPNSHISFGVGIHHCIGAAIARLEAITAVQQLFAKFPDIRFVQENEIKYEPTYFAREMKEFLVTLE